MLNSFPWSAIVAAVVWLVVAAGAWVWERGAIAKMKPPAVQEPWQHVQERFPVIEALPSAPAVSEAWLQAVTQANPFSPKRRELVQPPQANPTQPIAAPAPLAPVFVYKGRVLMGAKTRAVLQDANTKKTSFVEEGQQVAGFQVVAITEEEVTLSNHETGEQVTVHLATKEAGKMR
ncbi:MAG: hypothetical protein HYZ92_00500 [Candidatus Omnitrophica bacterium]|nr:hypothetical protein [Candidatus Omnitrophota bacterium]